MVAMLRARLGASDPSGALQGHSVATPGAAAIDVDLPLSVQAVAPEDPQPHSPSSSQDGTLDQTMARMDAGMHARQKLLDALKAQLSKSAPVPETTTSAASAHEEKAAALPSLASVTGAAAGRGEMPQGSAHALAAPVKDDETSTEVAPSKATMPVPAAVMQPDAKRPRHEETAGAAGENPTTSASLAAKKAAMLRALEEGPSEASASSALAQSQANPRVLLAPKAAAPKARAEQPGKPICPPNLSPEEHEAYRKECWRQYYEYCGLWQKYFEENQQDLTKSAFPKAPNGSGPASVRQPKMPAMSKPMQDVMRAPAAPSTRSSVSMVVARPLEDDIHSKLLGLP